MKKIIFPIMILLLSSLFISANQEAYKFKILASKGKISVSQGNGKWIPLKSSMALKETDKIKLDEKSYLGLVHESGRTVELDKAGEYSIKKLNADILKKKDKLSKKLTEYIVEEMSEAEDLFSNADYHESMGITGAVERSSELIITDYEDSGKQPHFGGKDYTIKLVFPYKTSIIGPEAEFIWIKAHGLEEYKFTLRDRFDAEVFSKIVKDTSIRININDLKLEKGAYYFWNVSQTPEQILISHDAAILFLTDNKAKEIQNELELIDSYFAGKDSPMKEIIKASYFEKNELYLDADKSYNKAMNILPETEEYEKMYAAFKFRLSREN